MIINILTHIIIFLFGFSIRHLIAEYVYYFKKDKLISDINNQFREVINNILLGKSIFKKRINNKVYIDTKLEDHGNVNLIYLIDERKIGIFKNCGCIYTSEMAEKEIIESLINIIDKKFKHKINDVVEYLGSIYSREYFNNLSNIMFESDVDKIISENESKFNIDDILDKINEVGIDNLTEEEKNFLQNYKS